MTEETSAEMWAREDHERREQLMRGCIYFAWVAGWLLRQSAKGAAMAIGGWIALHLIGVA